MDKKIRWKVNDPRGIEVVLYEETFETHIIDDHTSKDAIFRNSVEESAKKTIIVPHLIVVDPKYPSRVHYLRLEFVGSDSQKLKIKPIKVVVETSEVPNKIISFAPQNKLQGEFTKESVIYEK